LGLVGGASVVAIYGPASRRRALIDELGHAWDRSGPCSLGGRIDIDLDDEDTPRLLTAVGDLAERPPQWTLIGSLMEQLHAVEHRIADLRPTIDVDIRGEAPATG
jgi:hypothetical protein